MNKQIMSIANELVYNYALKAANEIIACSKLELDLSMLA